MHSEIEGMEARVNEGWRNVTNTNDNKLTLQLPKSRLLEAAGLGPNGCGSTFADPTSPTSEWVDMVQVSLSFTCAATGAVVDGTFKWEKGCNCLFISLSAEDAPESCGTLYWDPVLSPLNTAGGLMEPGALELFRDNDDIALIASILAAVVLLVVGVALWLRRRTKSRKTAKTKTNAKPSVGVGF